MIVLLWFTAWALTRVVADGSVNKVIVLACWIIAVVVWLVSGGHIRLG